MILLLILCTLICSLNLFAPNWNSDSITFRRPWVDDEHRLWQQTINTHSEFVLFHYNSFVFVCFLFSYFISSSLSLSLSQYTVEIAINLLTILCLFKMNNVSVHIHFHILMKCISWVDFFFANWNVWKLINIYEISSIRMTFLFVFTLQKVKLR